MKVTITFTPRPRIDYIISYKNVGETLWIIPPNNPTRSSPFYIDGLEEGQYDFKIESSCGIYTFQSTISCPGVQQFIAQNV